MKLKALALAVATLAVTAAAHAAPIVNTNVRPATINAGPATERTLQTVLDLALSAPTSAALDQSTAGMWGSSSIFPASTIPTLALEATGGEKTQTFGIWFGNDTDINKRFQYELFSGDACSYGSVECGATTPGGSGFNGFAASVGLQLQSGAMRLNNTTVVTNALINPSSFGFYFTTPALTAYSIDSMNAGGQTRFLAYQGGTTNDWVFAFEDGDDFDYNDMVVKVESIKVPEPGSLALLGLGLAGLAVVSRRKQKQA